MVTMLSQGAVRTTFSLPIRKLHGSMEVEALQEEADPERPILALPTDLQDPRDDVGGRREGVMARPPRAVAQADQAVLTIPATPDVEEAP